jgi:hypothetical protein
MEISRFENLFMHSQSVVAGQMQMSKSTALNSPASTDLNSAAYRILKASDSRKIDDLKRQERDIHAHEEAHYRSSGGKAFTPQYVYEVGPDGNKYAVKGTTKIILEEGKTSEETIKNARTARTAAMAPANPSDQDRKVILETVRMEQKARKKILESKKRQTKESSDNVSRINEDGEMKLDKPVKNTSNVKIFGMKLNGVELDSYKKGPSLKDFKNKSADKIIKKNFSSAENMMATLVDLYA